jgi:hypothetical protein
MAVIHARVLLAGAIGLGLAAVASPLSGQEARPGRDDKEPSKYTKSDVRRVTGQLAHDMHAFRSATRRLVDPGDVEDLAAEERLEGPSNDLEKAIDRLRTKVDGADDWWKALREASDVVLRSVDVNARLANVYAYTPVRPRWLAVRKQVNALARMYELHELAMPLEPPKPPKPEVPKQPQVHP